MNRTTHLFTIVCCCLFLSSCSLGFHRQWSSVSQKQQAPHKDLTGAWEGRWYSLKNGHHGKLKALVTQKGEEGRKTVYEFQYHATWARVFSGGYRARHLVDSNGRLTGEQDLGKLFGGVYRYEGTTTPKEFKATYECAVDKGVFEMKRPE